jgi:hypothetical protein
MLQNSLREVNINMDMDKVASYISQLGADAWLIGISRIQAQCPMALLFHKLVA